MFITVDCPDFKFDIVCVPLCQNFRTVVRTEFLDTTINNCQTGQETKSVMTHYEFISTDYPVPVTTSPVRGGTPETGNRPVTCLTLYMTRVF